MKRKEVLLLAKKNTCMGVMLIMDKNLNEKELYRRKIIEMVKKIDENRFLESIYYFIKAIPKKRE